MPKIEPYDPSIRQEHYLFPKVVFQQNGELENKHEEKVRQWFLRELIETYHYSKEDIEIEKTSSTNLKEIVSIPNTEDEISFLAIKFNELLQRIEKSFAFQKYFIQSHL